MHLLEWLDPPNRTPTGACRHTPTCCSARPWPRSTEPTPARRCWGALVGWHACGHLRRGPPTPRPRRGPARVAAALRPRRRGVRAPGRAQPRPAAAAARPSGGSRVRCSTWPPSWPPLGSSSSSATSTWSPRSAGHPGGCTCGLCAGPSTSSPYPGGCSPSSPRISTAPTGSCAADLRSPGAGSARRRWCRCSPFSTRVAPPSRPATSSPSTTAATSVHKKLLHYRGDHGVALQHVGVLIGQMRAPDSGHRSSRDPPPA